MEPESGRRSGPAVGIMVSRKVHLRAVKRNLWKRRIREAFRRRQKDLQPEWALVIQARKQTGVPAYREIEEELLTLCRKAKVLNSREAL